MLRGAAGKVMWVGRATVFSVGLAVILAVVFGAASTALGANGAPFLLGKQNFASQVSKLVKRGDGPALSLQVQDGQPPMKTNSSGKVANLNADQLDGKSEADFYAAGSKVADSDKLDGKDSAEFAADANQDGKADAAEHADSAASARNAADAEKLDGVDSADLLPGGTLPAGTTISGVYELGGNATAADQLVGGDSISFGFRLPWEPYSKLVPLNGLRPPGCPGTVDYPKADPGFLCVYEDFNRNIKTGHPDLGQETIMGIGIYAYSDAAGDAHSYGSWAVTSPGPE